MSQTAGNQYTFVHDQTTQQFQQYQVNNQMMGNQLAYTPGMVPFSPQEPPQRYMNTATDYNVVPGYPVPFVPQQQTQMMHPQNLIQQQILQQQQQQINQSTMPPTPTRGSRALRIVDPGTQPNTN